MSAAVEVAPDLSARAAWEAQTPLPRLGTPAGDAVAWSFANTCANHDDASMARCWVDMGLRRVATLSRGSLRWWPADYHRPSVDLRREAAAGLNRFMRDSRVHLLREAGAPGIIPAPDLMIAVDVDAGGGEWRTLSGGAFGEDWISLGAFCWRCSRGRAAARIAQVCGYRRLPRVGDLR